MTPGNIRSRTFSRLPSIQWRSASQSRTVVSLAYDLYKPPREEDAKAAPILFLHGLFGSKKNNRSISKVFARDLKRPVYALDLRNHGSSPHDPKHDYTSMAEDVEGFIQEHGFPRVILIGHSMGAKTAMTLALKKPDIVEGLVSVDNAPIDATLKSDFAKYTQGMRKIEDAGLKKQTDADAILAEYEESLPIRQFLLTNLIRNDDTGLLYFRVPIKTLAGALDNMGDFPYKSPDDVRFEKPTLFVRGMRSHYIADETLPVIGQFFPRFQLCDIEAGHWVISENPEAFREAVEEFLSKKND